MHAKMPEAKRGFSSLIEPLYAPGHVLMDDDLTAGTVFTRSLSRLLFRSIFGCGVICGYEVTPKLECERLKITVEAGVALDCHGDPVELKSEQTLCVGEACGEKIPGELWVLIRGAQHACAPRELACPSDDEDDGCGCHATRAKAGYELKVVDKLPCGACGCGEKQPPGPPAQLGKGLGQIVGAAPPPAAAPPASYEALNTLGRARLERLTAETEASGARAKALTKEAAELGRKVGPLEKAAEEARLVSERYREMLLSPDVTPDQKKAAEEAFKVYETRRAEYEEVALMARTRATQAHVETMKASALAKRTEDFRIQMGEAYIALEAGQQPASSTENLIAPRLPCHKDHYAGVCSCCCGDGCDGWVVLARVAKVEPPKDPKTHYEPYAADYSDRRFIRPVLAVDPLRPLLS